MAEYALLRASRRREEIASAILYLASDHVRFVTRAAFQIDGGTTAGHPRHDEHAAFIPRSGPATEQRPGASQERWPVSASLNSGYLLPPG